MCERDTGRESLSVCVCERETDNERVKLKGCCDTCAPLRALNTHTFEESGSVSIFSRLGRENSNNGFAPRFYRLLQFKTAQPPVIQSAQKRRCIVQTSCCSSCHTVGNAKTKRLAHGSLRGQPKRKVMYIADHPALSQQISSPHESAPPPHFKGKF